MRQQPNFRIGDLVLIAGKHTSHGQWPKALVEQVLPNSEGIVRRVVVRTANGVYHRDTRILSLLEEKLLSCIDEQVKEVWAVPEQ